MPNSHTDHEATSGRTTAGYDVHDIRALTDTGAITLPQHHRSVLAGESRPED